MKTIGTIFGYNPVFVWAKQIGGKNECSKARVQID